ncbi:outer membrane beta-barrel protein [Bacteroides sp. 224]|uniref:outer membrane beta-barrel protein n=1 Tax=Bacteroides sp. 224 TaxID=2302936 RepID=UPI0013D39A7F|nr:outer membrane beta-barrel protein [Bacteroides sp. 224]NDV65670.1 hypothetical protein [Bacteroides sp. 224]
MVKVYSGEWRGNYMINSKQLYTDDRSYAYLDMGLSGKFLKNRNLNISLTAKDVFDSRKFELTRYYSNIVRNIRTSRSFSQVMLRAVFYFSGGAKFNREASEDPNDTSRF